jgi:DNA-binding NarL/FixJ family response regulator
VSITAPEPLSLVIIDDQPIFRAGIRAALRATDHSIEIVGEANDEREGIRLVVELAPAVLLLNIDVAGLDALQTIRDVRRASPSVAVVFMTAEIDDQQLFDAIKCGAAAYVPRSIDIHDLCINLHRVAQGEYLINDTVLAKPVLATRLLTAFRVLTEDHEHVDTLLYRPLSAREIEVLEHIAQGNSNKAVAAVLHISDQTVKNHVTAIMRKLAVNDRTQAVVYALHQGWITA